MEQYKDFFEADVYRHGYYDCTNNGASKRHEKLFVVARHVTFADVKELVEKMQKDGKNVETDQFFIVDYQFFERCNYIRLIPIETTVTKRHSMFGGNYLTVGTHDPRFTKLVCNCPYPVPIHDRYE